MSVIKISVEEAVDWKCLPCNEELVPVTVELAYLDSLFNVELPTCPKCGMVFIPESLATGKMYNVEHMLEDK
ncbi:DNA-binding protein [Pseudodesulfovibrio cashew]|uniref:DNA-binding protein n=1 Tax=Pseudodesulfovibrio cashew TaxID=2678688 RepID=A0A6I6JF88_9BACT|nr:CLJU_RS11820 family redox protein [Pseudodesulfovibrio cashew]QGY41495.1 DNA-binding protein [Pseudodesulfovibrio cashew]